MCSKSNKREAWLVIVILAAGAMVPIGLGMLAGVLGDAFALFFGL